MVMYYVKLAIKIGVVRSKYGKESIKLLTVDFVMKIGGLLASAGGEDSGIAATANGQKKLSRSSLDEQSLLLGSPLLENSQTSQADFGCVVVGKDKTQHRYP
ncbi:unnamed protein product [Wuchereria bancrofti]|uniref:Uncharacterized protein n=1 Tax=Wuchereria bancrofti TaxID=6293 RepID=A0A3P7DM05_WUCBA|nr:unnamed protein product [Wuchereria bancrofti]